MSKENVKTTSSVATILGDESDDAYVVKAKTVVDLQNRPSEELIAIIQDMQKKIEVMANKIEVLEIAQLESTKRNNKTRSINSSNVCIHTCNSLVTPSSTKSSTSVVNRGLVIGGIDLRLS